MSATLIILLCALVCPLSMVLMMIFMRKGHDESPRGQPDRPTKAQDERVD
jgi:hypothetical protein